MKVLVVSNCNTPSYYGYLVQLFPEWETKAVVHTQAVEWIKDGHAPFLDFLAEVDLFVGLPSFWNKLASELVSDHTVAILLPGFEYMATRPDCFWLPRVVSPMEVGNIHSRLVAAAYYVGKSREEALALFNGSHFEAVGFFTDYEQGNRNLIAEYANHDLDISGDFDEWRLWGDFMYSTNHPDSRVLFDILHRSLSNFGFQPQASREEVENERASFRQHLSNGVIWPVYPEIAERFEIANRKERWRTSVDKSDGTFFDLEEMIVRSYGRLEEVDEAKKYIRNFLGEEEHLALLAGA